MLAIKARKKHTEEIKHIYSKAGLIKSINTYSKLKCDISCYSQTAVTFVSELA